MSVPDILKELEVVKAYMASRPPARYLASMAATMPVGAFDELQQALGLTHHPHAWHSVEYRI